MYVLYGAVYTNGSRILPYIESVPIRRMHNLAMPCIHLAYCELLENKTTVLTATSMLLQAQ